MSDIAFSVKQMAILAAIKCKRSDGECCDVYDLMDSLPYKVNRDALLHSVGILVRAGYVERVKAHRLSRGTRAFQVTPKGAAVAK